MGDKQKPNMAPPGGADCTYNQCNDETLCHFLMTAMTVIHCCAFYGGRSLTDRWDSICQSISALTRCRMIDSLRGRTEVRELGVGRFRRLFRVRWSDSEQTGNILEHKCVEGGGCAVLAIGR